MINFLFVIKIVDLLIVALSFWLAFWVYFANRKSKVNQFFSLFTVFILLWIVFSYFLNLSTESHQGIWWIKLGYVAAFLFLVSVYFFVTVFPKEKRFPSLDKLIIIAGIILCSISIFTDWLVKDTVYTKFGASPVLGKGAIYVIIALIFLSSLILGIIFKKYSKVSKQERLKIQYFLVGLIIFIIMNVIFNVILSPQWEVFPYYHFGNYSIIFLLGFTAYAIVKRELFDIKVVLTQLLVGVIGLILFVQSIVAETLGQKIFGFALFILFCISGYFLIRSVLKEIELRKELEKAYKELKKIDESKTEFLSITSHQLRSPLTAIKGYLSMVLSGNYGKVEGGVKKFLENVYISSERLIKLVNNLLDVNRLQMGKMKFEFKEIQIEDIVKDVIKDFLPQAKKKGLSLKFVSRQARNIRLPKVRADSQKIRQVVLNLVDNAIKYTEEGEVRVRFQCLDSGIQIVNEDTGIGFKKEEADNIFKMFDRGGNKALRVNPEGVGIGLYIAREMVRAHKGKIWAEPRKKGSRFIVELPIAHE